MSTAQETLAREAQWRPYAGAAALVAAVMFVAGGIWQLVVNSDQPRVLLLTALRAAEDPPAEDIRTPGITFVHDKAASLVASQALVSVAYALTAVALFLLFQAARARRPESTRLGGVLALLGPGVVSVMGIAFWVALVSSAGDYVSSSDHSHAAADDAVQSGFLSALGFLISNPGPGPFLTGLAFVLVALAAMQAGLLTRFMGILGMFVGGATVFLPGNPIHIFWLVALGVLLLGYWPSGVPPAWATGEAVPWPTQQELREQREAAQRPQALQRKSLPEEPAPKEPAPKEHSSSKKKKRRRRN